MRNRISLRLRRPLFSGHQPSVGCAGRRAAAVCGALTVAMLVTSGKANGQGAPVITVDSPLAWLRITPSTDARFASEVDAAIGADVSPAITEVLPYSVVITNSGGPPLAAIDVRFCLRFGTRTVFRNFFYHSFPDPGSPLLPTGHSILITPLKTSNFLAGRGAQAQASGGGGVQPGPRDALVAERLASADGSAIHQLAASDSVGISVDLAVTPDGRMAGPDAARTARKLIQQRDAYTFYRSECIDRIAQGQSDDAIQEWLVHVAEQKIFRDPHTGWSDKYVTTAVSVAGEWLRELRAGGRSSLRSKLLASPPDMEYPVVGSLKGGLQ